MFMNKYKGNITRRGNIFSLNLENVSNYLIRDVKLIYSSVCALKIMHTITCL